MPLKKKHPMRNTIIIWTLVAVLIVLMFVYFAPIQHTTEIVLFS